MADQDQALWNQLQHLAARVDKLFWIALVALIFSSLLILRELTAYSSELTPEPTASGVAEILGALAWTWTKILVATSPLEKPQGRRAGPALRALEGLLGAVEGVEETGEGRESSRQLSVISIQ